MAHDLFSDVSSPTVRYRSSSRWTMPLSIAAHVAIVAVVVIIPLMAADVLPTPDSGRLAFVAAMPTPPLPPAPRPPVTAAARPTTEVNPNMAPIVAPDKIGEEVIPAVQGAVGGVDFSSTGVGPVDSVGFGTTVSTAPEPPPPPAPPTRPVRVGGAVRQPVRVKGVPPVYPAIAQAARVAGTVVIDAVIDVDGTVRDARVLSGPSLLSGAALDAVRQWRYTPTTLNNQPVQVVMTVHVTFTLQ